jgi:hypothetical protein
MQDVVPWLSGIFGLAGALGGAWAIFRERSFRSTLDAMRVGNQEVRDLWEMERTARADAESRHAMSLREQEAACAKQLAEQDCKIAELTGKVDVLTSSIVGSLVSELKDALVDAVHAAIAQGDRRSPS